MLKQTLTLLILTASLLIAANAHADLVIWTVDKPAGLTTTGSVAITHGAAKDFVVNPLTSDKSYALVNGFKVGNIDATTRRFQVELDARDFYSNQNPGINWVAITFSPDAAGDYLTGLRDIKLFGQDAQDINGSQFASNGLDPIYSDTSLVGSVDFSKTFYFNTDDLFDADGDTLISFDIGLRGSGIAALEGTWSITVATGYAEPKNAAPEPATMLILGLGIAGLGLARRRK